MHKSSMEEMRAFVGKLPWTPLKIAEVGSRESNGSYRPLFKRPEWVYAGLDLTPGVNVDVVLGAPYEWGNVASNSFDVVVSGQTLEHTERPWLWIKEISRIVRPRGVVCVIAPYKWDYHPSPLDCWRVFPDGLRTIMLDAGLTILKIHMNRTTDTVGVATKGPASDVWHL